MKPSDIIVLETESPTQIGLTVFPPTQSEATGDGPEVIMPGAVVGVIAGFTAQGLPLVDFPDNPGPAPVLARTTVALLASDANREAVLWFEQNELRKPIVMGLLQSAKATQETPRTEEVVFAADKELVLRCGKASITLTRAGKVIIRGAYLLSRSSGVNRIKGGSVQIN